MAGEQPLTGMHASLLALGLPMPRRTAWRPATLLHCGGLTS